MRPISLEMTWSVLYKYLVSLGPSSPFYLLEGASYVPLYLCSTHLSPIGQSIYSMCNIDHGMPTGLFSIPKTSDQSYPSHFFFSFSGTELHMLK